MIPGDKYVISHGVRWVLQACRLAYSIRSTAIRRRDRSRFHDSIKGSPRAFNEGGSYSSAPRKSKQTPASLKPKVQALTSRERSAFAAVNLTPNPEIPIAMASLFGISPLLLILRLFRCSPWGCRSENTIIDTLQVDPVFNIVPVPDVREVGVFAQCWPSPSLVHSWSRCWGIIQYFGIRFNSTVILRR